MAATEITQCTTCFCNRLLMAMKTANLAYIQNDVFHILAHTVTVFFVDQQLSSELRVNTSFSFYYLTPTECAYNFSKFGESLSGNG